MDKRLAKAWKSDLLSGKFKQCRGELRDSLKGVAYCCIGVLSCRIGRRKAVKATGWTWTGSEWVDPEGNHAADECLPTPVREAIGMGDVDETNFIDANDRARKTFKQIAKLVGKTYGV